MLWVLLAFGQKLFCHNQRDFMNQWVVSKEIGLLVESINTLIQGGFIGDSQLLSCLNLLLDLILELGHVKHQLVYFAAPHCQFLSLELVLEICLPNLDLFSSVHVADSPELSKATFHFHPVDMVPGVSSNPLFLLSSLEPSLPPLQVGFVVSQPGLHLEESLDAALVLGLEPLKFADLSFLLLDGLKEPVDVGLLLIQVHLVVVLILSNVALFQVFILFKHSLVELKEKLVVGGLELLDMSIVVRELNLFSNDSEVGASVD